MRKRGPYKRRKLYAGQQRVVDVMCERVATGDPAAPWFSTAYDLAAQVDPTRGAVFRNVLRVVRALKRYGLVEQTPAGLEFTERFELLLEDKPFYDPASIARRHGTEEPERKPSRPPRCADPVPEPEPRRGRPPQDTSPVNPEDELVFDGRDLEDPIKLDALDCPHDVVEQLVLQAERERDSVLPRVGAVEPDEADHVEEPRVRNGRRFLPLLPPVTKPSALLQLVAEELPAPEPPPRPPAEPRALALPCGGHTDPGVTREQQRSRRKHLVRAKTINVKRMTKRELEIGRIMYPPVEVERPRTRADCARFCRPCPFVSCRWHLYLDVSSSTGAIKLNFPHLEPDELEYSCALDVADVGGATLEQVGYIANVTRERVRQIEVRALGKLTRSGLRLALEDDEHRVPVRAVAV